MQKLSDNQMIILVLTLGMFPMLALGISFFVLSPIEPTKISYYLILGVLIFGGISWGLIIGELISQRFDKKVIESD